MYYAFSSISFFLEIAFTRRWVCSFAIPIYTKFSQSLSARLPKIPPHLINQPAPEFVFVPHEDHHLAKQLHRPTGTTTVFLSIGPMRVQKSPPCCTYRQSAYTPLPSCAVLVTREGTISEYPTSFSSNFGPTPGRSFKAVYCKNINQRKKTSSHLCTTQTSPVASAQKNHTWKTPTPNA